MALVCEGEVALVCEGEVALSCSTWLLQKLKQAELNVKDHGALLQREMATWKASCEKMTASLSRKEMEVQQLHKKLDDYHTQVRARRGCLPGSGACGRR